LAIQTKRPRIIVPAKTLYKMMSLENKEVTMGILNEIKN